MFSSKCFYIFSSNSRAQSSSAIHDSHADGIVRLPGHGSGADIRQQVLRGGHARSLARPVLRAARRDTGRQLPAHSDTH